MYKAMKKKEVPPTPIEFDFKESKQRKLVKQLVGAMLHPNPDKRPDIGDVLNELRDIAGTDLNVYMYVYYKTDVEHLREFHAL